MVSSNRFGGIMITYITGNILSSDSALITIPVNCVGVAGAGLAKSWKIADPVAHVAYVIACKKNQIVPGAVKLLYHEAKLTKWCMFPTKLHWANPSQLDWIRDGLADLSSKVKDLEIRSVSLCRLGCGLGGLDFDKQVKPLIESTPRPPDVEIKVYQ